MEDEQWRRKFSPFSMALDCVPGSSGFTLWAKWETGKQETQLLPLVWLLLTLGWHWCP